jgi:hypothetical protein
MTMHLTLSRFLAADDLDELAAAREEITEITRDDAHTLEAIVDAQTDRQALANLLMYPDVIPEHQRAGAMFDALSGDVSDYLTLAAAVGVGHVEFDDDMRAQVAGRLLDIARNADEPLSILAGRSFGAFADALDLQLCVERLGDFRPSERHNVLAGLLAVHDDIAIRKALSEARAFDLMSPYDTDDVERRLDEGADPDSLARLTLLTYIPNLSETRNMA